MKALPLAPLVFLAIPSLAHATARGVILHHAPDTLVASGQIRNASGLAVTYRAENAWWLYENGQKKKVVDDPVSIGGLWIAGSGVVYGTQAGEIFYFDGSSSTRLIGFGDPCPDGSNRTIDALPQTLVAEDNAFYVSVVCGLDADLYRVGVDGSTTQIVYTGMSLPTLAGGTDQPQLLGSAGLEEWVATRAGDVLFTGQTTGCVSDPLCPSWGTFRVGGTEEALHGSGIPTPGIPPEQQAMIMTHLRANEAGDVAFILGGPFDAVVSIYVWQRDGHVRHVVSTGDPAVGTGEEFYSFDLVDGQSDVKHFQIDTDGYVSFTARTTMQGPLTLWHETGAGIGRLVWPGQELPGYPGSSVVSVDAVRTSPDGRLAAMVTNGAGQLPSQALVTQDAQGEVFVPWHREMEIRDGADSLTLVGQASFGDVEYPAFDIPGNGMDGRGLTFANDGRLLITITGQTESAAVVLQLDDSEPNNELGLDFVLRNDAPIYWGEQLDFTAVVSNLGESDITFHELTIDFAPNVTDPQVACGMFDFDAEMSILSPWCDQDALIPDSRDLGFSVRSPIRDTDGEFTFSGTLMTKHGDGDEGWITVESSFTLLASPEGVDLAVDVDDVAAATSFTVRNVGVRPATGVVARATLDQGAGFFAVPSDPRCQREGEELLLRCDLGDLAPGGEIEVEFPAQSDGTGTLEVESNENDENPGDNSVRFTLLITTDLDPPVEGACDCRSADPRPEGAALSGLVLLLLVQRRRSPCR